MSTSRTLSCAVRWLGVAISLLVSVSVFAQQPKIEATLQAPDHVWSGQKLTLVVELSAPGYFSSAASFDLPDAAGVLLLPPAGHPIVSGRTIGDTYYSVQRHELAVYPTTAGAHVVPPIHVRFSYKLAPLDRDEQRAEVVTSALTFQVATPPGAENLGQVISARGLQATETWSPEPGKAPVQAGAAFTRTITFTAPEVPGMVFPPFPAEPIPGLRLYPKAPVLLDHSERSALTGGRRDIIVYVCERAGRFNVPAVRLTWWDLDAQALRTVDFPARTLVVKASATAPSPSETGAQTSPMRRSQWWGLSLAALLLISVIAGPRLRPVWQWLVAPLRPVRLQPLNPGGP